MLSPVQRSLVIGTMLGDGAMRCKMNALLEINHCIDQREYVDWKYNILRDLVRTAPKARRGNGRRVAYRFTTLSVPELTPIYRLFYRGREKVAPQVDLDPLAVAVWFMDDGSKSRRSIYFNTQQFDVADQSRLMQMLKDRWDLDCTLNSDKSYYRIRVAIGSVGKLRAVIDAHVLPLFRYKLPD